jgi:hypothetical protein
MVVNLNNFVNFVYKTCYFLLLLVTFCYFPLLFVTFRYHDIKPRSDKSLCLDNPTTNVLDVGIVHDIRRLCENTCYHSRNHVHLRA